MGGAGTIEQARREAASCRRCPLWREATQTVFGEGSQNAAVVLVGEQPGEHEDAAGRPFVGPAGRVLDRALQDAGIDRSHAYTTNAVKHFKYRLRGRRRIHQRPAAGEVSACRPWLQSELALLSPSVVVALGATAAYSLFGRATGVGANRGRPLESALFSPVVVTAHPSSVLRERDEDTRDAAMAALVQDLTVAAALIAAGAERGGAP